MTDDFLQPSEENCETSTDIVADGCDLVPAYTFSEFGTSAPVPYMNQPWPYARKPERPSCSPASPC